MLQYQIICIDLIIAFIGSEALLSLGSVRHNVRGITQLIDMYTLC